MRNSRDHIDSLLFRITLPDDATQLLNVRTVHDSLYLIRFEGYEKDNFTGAPSLQFGKWWALDTVEMSDQVILNTVFQAYETYVLHELRERWLVDGKPIYMHKH